MNNLGFSRYRGFPPLFSCLALLLCLWAPAAGAGPSDATRETVQPELAHPGADLWRDIRQREKPLTGTSQSKNVDASILINAEGYRWASFRTGVLTRYGSALLLTTLLLLLGFYVLRGKVKLEGGLSGDMLKRFSRYQRLVHWLLALVFIFLALTGLVLLFGRWLLIPLLGQQAFSMLASASKEGHNLFGFLFIVSLAMMLFSYTRRNLYARGDLRWLLSGGGYIGRQHVSAGFFNMGEKSWYWLLILVGMAVSVSGVILVTPELGHGRVMLEFSHVVHASGALLLITMSMGHMYLGSVGMVGSFEGMKSGYVDRNWAESHHDRWAKSCFENGEVISAEAFRKLQTGPGKR